MLKILFVAPLAMLSACATLVNGSSQSVTVSTTPPAATCTVDRMGVRIGAIPATPGSVHIDKSKNDLSVTCDKEGFKSASIVQSPTFSGATFGNIIAGGVIGVIVDAASGANYTYPADIRLDMAANPAPTLPPIALSEPSVLDAPIRIRPAAAQFDAQPAMVHPISVSAMDGAGPTPIYPR